MYCPAPRENADNIDGSNERKHAIVRRLTDLHPRYHDQHCHGNDAESFGKTFDERANFGEKGETFSYLE